MLYQYQNMLAESLLAMTDHLQEDERAFIVKDKLLRLIWNRQDVPICFWADDRKIELPPQNVVAVTYIHHIVWEKQAMPLTAFAFNKEFYCMQQHDDEVSCYGLLFFGAQHLPIVALPMEEIARFEMLYQIFREEFRYNDTVQGEMLLALLKRLVIKVTRIAKKQIYPHLVEDEKLELIRKFNFLVDVHYKRHKQVADYANMLHKSPKTLSNLFRLHNSQTPQQIIQERVALEAKRLLLYTAKSSKEIAYELGFEDANHFSKFFKKMFQKTPLELRSQSKNI
jgi:AraC-like DNA-binding protein